MGNQIFISYRREGGDILARMIYDRLRDNGYSPFLDVESLHSGKFNEQLYECIDECQDFVVVLTANSLDRSLSDENDWVRKEISYALSKNKNIIPVIAQDFSFPKELPPDIAELQLHNGVLLSLTYTDATIEKLKALLSSRPQKTKAQFTTKRKAVLFAFTTVITLIIISGIFLFCSDILNNNESKTFPQTEVKNITKEVILGGQTVPLDTKSLFLYTSDVVVYDDSYQVFLGDGNSAKEYYLTPKSIDYLYIEIDDRKEPLEQIRNLQNLENLVIIGAQCDDWSFISDLSRLQILSLEYNKINDITFVCELKELISLNISNNLIEDTSPLKELTGLSELGLCNNQIKDISPLKRMKNVWSLDLEGNLISDISALGSMTSLQFLVLNTNNISDISPLKNCINITHLYIDNNNVIDISTIGNLTVLQTLHASNNKISDISPLSNCILMNNLLLSGNEISDITQLAPLLYILRLYIDNNNITDVSPLSGMVYLTELKLQNNSIENLEPLLAMEDLRMLWLGGGTIDDISVLLKMTNLEYLYAPVGYELTNDSRVGYFSSQQYEELKSALPNCYIGEEP